METIEWQCPEKWMSLLDSIFSIKNRQFNKFTCKTIQYCWNDDRIFEYCELITGFNKNESVKNIRKSIKNFKIRLFHGCNSTNVPSIYKLGILRRTKIISKKIINDFIEKADAIGMSISQDDINKSLNTLDDDIDIGRLFLSLDHQGYLDGSAGHYLIYGSEFLQGHFGYKSQLFHKEHGIGTIVICDVPINMIPPIQQMGISESLLREYVRLKSGGGQFIPPIDHSVILQRNIPTEWIVGHWHPREIVDPLQGMVKKVNTNRSCPSCNDDSGAIQWR